MTTAAFDRAGRVADQVREESRQLDPVKVILTLLMIPFFVIGWTAGQTLNMCWTVFAWAWTAGVIGFRTARGDTGSP